MTTHDFKIGDRVLYKRTQNPGCKKIPNVKDILGNIIGIGAKQTCYTVKLDELVTNIFGYSTSELLVEELYLELVSNQVLDESPETLSSVPLIASARNQMGWLMCNECKEPSEYAEPDHNLQFVCTSCKLWKAVS
jgi:hypothetical protein